eukprot:5542087-Pyramimonas_sp.AAC.1
MFALTCDASAPNADANGRRNAAGAARGASVAPWLADHVFRPTEIAFPAAVFFQTPWPGRARDSSRHGGG